MKSKNPFNPSFGDIPSINLNNLDDPQTFIDTQVINSTFNQPIFITGIRGTGKTVFMTKCEKLLLKDPHYINIDIEDNKSLLTNTVTELQRHLPMKTKLKLTGLTIKLHNIDVQLETINHAYPDETKILLLKNAVKQLNDLNKTPILYIDDIKSSENLVTLMQTYMTLKRSGQSIFIFMTGLPRLIDNLQNNPNLTFLRRSHKLILQPFTNQTIRQKYERTLNIDPFISKKLTEMVDGYAFAFQLLGYLLFPKLQQNIEPLTAIQEITPQYKDLLFNESYYNIYNELSPSEQRYVRALSHTNGKYADTAKLLQLKPHSTDRTRSEMIKSHLIKPIAYGQVSFTLPYFKDFLLTL